MVMVMTVRGCTCGKVKAGCIWEAAGEGADGGGNVDGFSDHLGRGHGYSVAGNVLTAVGRISKF